MTEPPESPDPTSIDATLIELDALDFLSLTYTEAEGLELDSNVDYDRALALLSRAQHMVNMLIWRSEVLADEIDEDEEDDGDDGDDNDTGAPA